MLAAAAVKLLLMPVLVFCSARRLYPAMAEAQYAAVAQAASPGMVTAPPLAGRFRLDSGTAALPIGWTTILFWVTRPVVMPPGMSR